MTNERPLRILLVCHLPLRRDLGGARVQLEFAEELRRMGHIVDHYTLDDALHAGHSKGRSAAWSFPRRAACHVRDVGHSYDIVEGHQGDLPRSKRWLRVEGVLVVRSSGLFHSYRDFLRRARTMWPDQQAGTRAGNAVREMEWRSRLRRTERTFSEADLVNVPNEDERAKVQAMVPSSGHVVTIPNGIAHATLVDLRNQAGAPAQRKAAQRVAVIGTWDARKGARDWPVIIRRVWKDVPEARFAFLGTGASPDHVRCELGCEGDDRIEVHPRFAPQALPDLLRYSTVGALPSHIEGFGLGLVESLAAGLPSVAYAVPGPTETIGRLRASWLTPPGDRGAFAAALVNLLGASESVYAGYAQECAAFALRYSWRTVAIQTLDAYREAYSGLDEKVSGRR